MSYSGGLISKPVRTIDISQALGVASRDVGTLCTSDKINMWAKRKPFRYNAVAIPDAQKEAIRAACNYGVGWLKYASGAEVIAAMDGGIATWYKELPRGITYNEPFRMLDFDGYLSSARCPFSLEAGQAISETVTATTGLIDLEDPFIPSALQSYHLAITFKKGTTYKTYIDPQSIQEHGQYAKEFTQAITPSALGGYGSAKVYTYLVPTVPPSWVTADNAHQYSYGAGNVYPFPLEQGALSFNIKETALDISLDVDYYGTHLNWTAVLANNLVADAAFVCNEAKMIYGTQQGSVTVDYTSLFQSQTIAKGNSISVTRGYAAQSGEFHITYTLTFYGTMTVQKTKVIGF